MSRFERRWILRHPFQWVRICWWQWSVAGLLLVKGVILTDPIWEPTVATAVWPPVMAITAGVVIASAVAPLHNGLQLFTSTLLLFVSLSRAGTFLALWIVDTSPQVDTVAQAFATMWGFMALLAVRWTPMTTRPAGEMAAQIAVDDRGGRGG